MKKNFFKMLIAASIVALFASLASAGIDTSFDAEHLREINSRRAANGLPPLALSETLCRAARIRAKEIMTSMSHTRPNGSSCFSALTEVSSYSFGTCAENIAGGPANGKGAVDAFMNSEGHRANILGFDVTRIGVAAYIPGSGDVNVSGYPIYWVEMFAASAPDAATDPTPAQGGVQYGADQMWRQGSGAEGIDIVVRAPLRGMLGVKFDGAALDPSNYTVASADAPYEGSTSVKILKRYIDFVRPGVHTISFVTSPDIAASARLTAVSVANDFSSGFSAGTLSWRQGDISPIKAVIRGLDTDQLVAVLIDSRVLASGIDYQATARQMQTSRGAQSELTVEIAPSCLETLAPGDHVLTLAFTNGYAERTFTTRAASDGPVTHSGGGGGCSSLPAFALLAVLAVARRR